MILHWIRSCVRLTRSLAISAISKPYDRAPAIGCRRPGTEPLEPRRLLANLATDPFYLAARDFNDDGVIDAIDQEYVASRAGTTMPETGHLDLNGDGEIDHHDVELLTPHLGAARPEEPSLESPDVPPVDAPPEPPATPSPPPETAAPPPETPAEPPQTTEETPDAPVSGPVEPEPPPIVPDDPEPVPPTPPPVAPTAIRAYEALFDVDRDWDIDKDDLNLAATLIGPATPYNAHLDFDHSGRVDAFDIAAIAERTSAKPVDLNGDGSFNAFDFGLLVTAMASTAPDLRADLDGDGDVDAGDLGILEAAYETRLNTVSPPTQPDQPIPHDEPAEEPVDPLNQTIRIDPALRVGAYYDIGGDPQNIRNLSYNVQEVGWADTIDRYLLPVVNAGVRFAEFHNIWGRTDTARMSFPIYSQLVDHPDLPRLINGFVPAFQAFHDAHPDFQSIAYVGSPYTSAEIRALADDPDIWWEVVYETLVPLFDAGFTSIGFDASGADRIWQHPLDLELYDLLMHPESRLRDPERHAPLIEILGGDPADPDNPGRAVTVYFEALPVNNRRHGLPDRAGELGHDHMVITYQHYREQDPERRDENGKRTAKHVSFVWNGERFIEMEEINVILPNTPCRGGVGVDYNEAREACLHEMSDVLTERDRNAQPSGNIRLLVNPRFLVDLEGNQVKWAATTGDPGTRLVLQAHAENPTIDDFVEELDLDALPTRIDLDPDDLFSDEAFFRISLAPRHGVLALSPYDSDVMVYTPMSGFSGTDYLEYTVNDGGQQATGRITFEIK